MSTYRSKGEIAYGLAIDVSLTWAEIAELTDCAGANSAASCARAWAKKDNRPWPIRGRPSSADRSREASPQDRAHRMRSAGLKWREVASALGYCTPTAARAAAQAYASHRGMPWPIRVKR